MRVWVCVHLYLYIYIVPVWSSKLDLCEGWSFQLRSSSDIQRSVYSFSCSISVCHFVKRQRVPKIRTFCLVDIKKRLFLTSCVLISLVYIWIIMNSLNLLHDLCDALVCFVRHKVREWQNRCTQWNQEWMFQHAFFFSFPNANLGQGISNRCFHKCKTQFSLAVQLLQVLFQSNTIKVKSNIVLRKIAQQICAIGSQFSKLYDEQWTLNNKNLNRVQIKDQNTQEVKIWSFYYDRIKQTKMYKCLAYTPFAKQPVDRQQFYDKMGKICHLSGHVELTWKCAALAEIECELARDAHFQISQQIFSIFL